MARKAIEEVVREHATLLASLPGVTGIAHGEWRGRPCIKVYVERKTDWLMRQIPSRLNGYRVSVEETGTFRALTPGRNAKR